jgi:hypothetical protein
MEIFKNRDQSDEEMIRIIAKAQKYGYMGGFFTMPIHEAYDEALDFICSNCEPSYYQEVVIGTHGSGQCFSSDCGNLVVNGEIFDFDTRDWKHAEIGTEFTVHDAVDTFGNRWIFYITKPNLF